MKNGFFSRRMIGTRMLAAALLFGCASGKKEEDAGNKSPAIAASNDILELLTGFGESVSKKDFTRAVEYLVPRERALMRDASGHIPEDKQKALMALSLQRLIRDPSVHMENGYLAGIHDIISRPETARVDSTQGAPISDSAMVAQATSGTVTPIPLPAEAMQAATANESAPQDSTRTSDPAPDADPLLQETVKKFFSAIRQQNWSAALAMINADEKKAFLDEKGKLSEASKARLSRIDISNRGALMLQDGKLTGVSLIVPSK